MPTLDANVNKASEELAKSIGTTTTDPPQQKKEDSPPKKTLGQKTISLLVDSSIFAAAGALLYANNKLFKTAAANLFDSILGVIGWRTE